ncbi:MAG: flagellar basal body-associated protein FliL [bacterium]
MAEAGAKKGDAAAEGEAPAGAETAKTKANPLAGVMGILGNKVTFIVSLVVVEVIVAYFVVTALIEPRLQGDPVAQAEEEKKKKEEKPVHMELVSLKDIVVNLNGSEGSRYLAAGVTLELEAEPAGGGGHGAEAGNEKEPLLKHAVISVLSAKSIAEVSTAEGRELIRREIQEHAEEVLGHTKVNAVYFTEFVVQ